MLQMIHVTVGISLRLADILGHYLLVIKSLF